jgi:stage V sporulation protein SpoVS
VAAVITLAVTPTTSVHGLARSICETLGAERVIVLEADEAKAVNQAVKAMAIARGKLALDLTDLDFRPGLTDRVGDWNESGVRIEVRLDE